MTPDINESINRYRERRLKNIQSQMHCETHKLLHALHCRLNGQSNHALDFDNAELISELRSRFDKQSAQISLLNTEQERAHGIAEDYRKQLEELKQDAEDEKPKEPERKWWSPLKLWDLNKDWWKR